ncbi:MAG: hypothetical protein K2G30_06335, partial [Muribaculaceae bacterium]|nr:hypothetical protein [Muribaculaceae bacterium]
MKKSLLLFLGTLAATQLCSATPPSGEWKAIGSATYYEGLMTVFNQDLKDCSWPVAMEQNEASPGWYRLAPYAEGTWFASEFNYSDTEYIYINATDPEKVYTEDFVLLQQFTFWQLCPEGGVKTQDRYGKLTNGVISFPQKSHYWEEIETPTGQKIGNPDGEFRIVLPGYGTEIWKTLGTTTFTDGICGPLYAGKAVETEVTVQERFDKPGYYRLVGAWAPHGSSATLEIDASNPDFVTIPLQNVGRETDERGETNVVSVSATYVFEGSDWDIARFEAQLPEKVIRMTNGVITIPENGCVFHFPSYSLLTFSDVEKPAVSL